ncbi:MAG: hypothetical protein ACI395_00110, partial [Candidatus Cryptobacteroides sp.]
MNKSVNNKIYAALAAISIFAACTDDGQKNGEPAAAPEVSFGSFELKSNKLSFEVVSRNAIAATYLVVNDAVHPDAYSAEDAFADGVEVDANTTASVSLNLEWDCSYTIYVAAASIDGQCVSASRKVSLTNENYYDLGDPANTYIVSEAGFYGFKTKKVDGSLITVVSVDWLWATGEEPYAKEQTVISDVALTTDENGVGVVTFRTTGTEGNAVIVGFDSMGEITWSWLIWCTDRPQTKQINETTYFLDRAIGATAATQEEGTKAWHVIMYQFGRLSPFFSGYEDEWNGQEFDQAKKWTVVNPQLAAGFYWTVDNGQKATQHEADKHPMTFYTGNDNKKDGIWFSGVWDYPFLYSWYGIKQEDGE